MVNWGEMWQFLFVVLFDFALLYPRHKRLMRDCKQLASKQKLTLFGSTSFFILHVSRQRWSEQFKSRSGLEEEWIRWNMSFGWSNTSGRQPRQESNLFFLFTLLLLLLKMIPFHLLSFNLQNAGMLFAIRFLKKTQQSQPFLLLIPWSLNGAVVRVSYFTPKA